MLESELFKTLGQVAYEAYCKAREWKSFDGDVLPQWLDVKPEIKIAWEYSATTTLQEWLSNNKFVTLQNYGSII